MNEYAAEVERINGNVASTYTALSEMGATMPAQQNSDNLPGTVLTVPQGGGSSVQTDWNQTDDTAPDFLKNKPFGEMSSVIMEEQEIVYDAAIDGYLGLIVSPVNVGDVLTITYDGTEYECEVLEVEGYVCFGNFGLMGMEDTGEPFIGMVFADGILFTIQDATNHTVGITARQTKRIDSKYVDSKAVFYFNHESEYVYIDAFGETKATKEELLQAVKAMPIVLSIQNTHYYYPQSVEQLNNYVKVSYLNGTTVHNLYTAEYTPTT